MVCIDYMGELTGKSLTSFLMCVHPVYSMDPSTISSNCILNFHKMRIIAQNKEYVSTSNAQLTDCNNWMIFSSTCTKP